MSIGFVHPRKDSTLHRLLLVLAIIFPLLVLPSATPPSSYAGADTAGFIVPRGSQGLEFGQVIDDNGQIRFTDEIASRIALAGATWVHVNFRLGGFEDWTETATFGYSALDLYDQVVATADRHGLQVVGLLSNETWRGHLDNWQAGNAENGEGVGDNEYLREFAVEAAVVLARHFAGRVDYWEVWNEPNADITFLHPSNFAWLLSHVYIEVKSAGVHSARFISGGVTSMQAADGAATEYSTGAEYLRATYAAGKEHAGWDHIRAALGSYPLDAIGQHIYVDGFRQTDRLTVRTALQRVRDAYVDGEGGDGSKLTIVTEMGWASGNVSERVQADNLQIAFAEIIETPYVQTASWFFLRDEPDSGLGFGLLRSNGSEKPAWGGYRVITIPEAPPIPPSGVHATGFATDVRLEWHANAAPDLAGYLVYRGESLSGPFVPLTAELLAATGIVDTTAPPDVPVFYRVTAVDTLGNESGESITAGAIRSDRPNLDEFDGVWQRTDLPVADGRVQRTWIWGATPVSGVITERYDESPGGFRQVQYFDKSRMELNDPDTDEDSTWNVTNGLLVWELMSGWMQVGDGAYIERKPAGVNVAGDPDSGPTYAALSPLRWAAALDEDEPITSRVDVNGAVTNDPLLAERDIRAVHYVEQTDHTVAGPFWDFMNSEGPIDDEGQPADDLLFENPFYATGFPITEAYWTEVEVNEIPTDVLIQCFQRRCLTYTPDNAPGWQVEAGNVGWHYYQWRYE
ncbi:hypothetical protein BH23CHL2_BH23CHL2_15310 [soil metagenome]